MAPRTPVEGQAPGGEQHRIHRGPRRDESRVKMAPLANSCGEPFFQIDTRSGQGIRKGKVAYRTAM